MKSAFLVMESMGVPEEEKLDVWDRIQRISHHLLKVCRDEAERKAKAKQGHRRGY